MSDGVYVPSAVGEGYFSDWQTPASGSTDNAKVWAFNATTRGWEPAPLNFEPAGAVAAHVALANPHSQYLLASGVSAYGATLLDDADAAAARGTLGLGTIATQAETGYLLASGARAGAVSGVQSFTSGISVTAPPGNAISVAMAPSVVSGFFDAMFFTLDDTNMSGSSGWNLLHINKSGPETLGGSSYYIRLQKNSVDFFTFDKRGELLWKPHGLSGFSALQFDGGNTAAVYGFFRATNAPDGVSLRNALTTDNGNGVGFRLSLTTTAAYTAVSNKAAKILVLGNGQTSPINVFSVRADGIVQIDLDSTTTNTLTDALIVNQRTSGSPAAGLGAAILAQIESSTTEGQNAGRLAWQWTTATHTSRASKGQLSAYYTTTERPAITWGADSSNPLLSFYDLTTPIARQVLATGAGATVDQVITALQNLGLVKQS